MTDLQKPIEPAEDVAATIDVVRNIVGDEAPDGVNFSSHIARVLLGEIDRLKAQVDKHHGDAVVYESRYLDLHDTLDRLEAAGQLPTEPGPPVSKYTPRRSFAYGVWVGSSKRWGGLLHAESMEEAAYHISRAHKLKLVSRGYYPWTNRWEWETEDGKRASIYVWARPEDLYFKPLRENNDAQLADQPAAGA